MKKILFLPIFFAFWACKAQSPTIISQPIYVLKWAKVGDSVRAPIYFQGTHDTLATQAYARGFAGGSLGAGYGIKVTGSTIAIDSFNYRKMDSLYPVTDSTAILKINGRAYSYKMRGAVFSFNGRAAAIVPLENDYAAFYPKLDSLYNDPAWIGTLNWLKIVNIPQTLGGYGITNGVANGGGVLQWIADIEANRPTAPANGTFFFGIDDSVIRYFNGSRYIIAGGGGGVSGPDSIYRFQYGLNATRSGDTVNVKVDTTTLKQVFGSGSPGVVQLFTKYGLIINGTDTASVDTTTFLRWTDTVSKLPSRSWVLSRGFLTAETDPIATAKTITITGTSGRGIAIAGTAGQVLGANPTWTFTLDTTYGATLLALKDSAAALRTAIGGGGGISQVYNKYGTVITGGDSIAVDTTLFPRYKDTLSGPLATRTYVTGRGYLTTETDPVATAKMVSMNQLTNRGILITGLTSQPLSGNPSWTFVADTGYLSTLLGLTDTAQSIRTFFNNKTSQIFNKYGTFITGGDSVAVDTTKFTRFTDTVAKLATQSFVTGKNYLTAETDPVAIAKTVTLNGTSGRGIAIAGTAGQTIGGNPTWTLTADSTYLATLLALKDTSITLRGIINSKVGQIFNKYGTIISGGDSVTVDTTLFLRWKDTVTKAATQYFVTSKGYLTAETDPIALAKVITVNGTANRGISVAGIAGQALTSSPTWTFTLDTTYAATRNYVQNNFLPNGGAYHLKIQAANSSAGDTSYISGHDSTLVVTGIVDSLGFHHYVQNGRLVMYAAGGGSTTGPDTASIAQVLTTTGDSLKVNTTSVPAYLGTKVFVPAYTTTAAGLMSVPKGKRLDSTVTAKLGSFHRLVRAPWTQDSIEFKGINLEDTTGRLSIHLVGDTAHGLNWDIDASGLAGTGTVDSVTLIGSGSPIVSLTMTGNTKVNPTLNLSAGQGCAYCFLWNNNAGSAIPSYGKPSLTSPAFASQGTATTLLHGSASGNLSWSAINYATDGTGTLPVGSLPAFGGGQVAGAVGTGILNIGAGAITGANIGAGAVSLTTQVQGTLPAGLGGTGTGNSGQFLFSDTVRFSHPIGGNVTIASSGITQVTLPTGTSTLLSTTGAGTSLSGITWGVTGTPNEILVNNNTTTAQVGNLILALPQGIAPANTPVFTNLIASAMTTTGIPKYTTGTGFSIATPSDFPTLNQNTSGTAAALSAASTLPNGTTATTQATTDSSNNVATTKLVKQIAAGFGVTVTASSGVGDSVATVNPANGQLRRTTLYTLLKNNPLLSASSNTGTQAVANCSAPSTAHFIGGGPTTTTGYVMVTVTTANTPTQVEVYPGNYIVTASTDVIGTCTAANSGSSGMVAGIATGVTSDNGVMLTFIPTGTGSYTIQYVFNQIPH